MMINIREKLQKYGTESLTTQELIAVILGNGTKNCDVTRLSAQVLISSHNLKRLNLDILLEQKGVGHAQACKLLAAVELGARKIERDELSDKRLTMEELGEHLIKKIGNSPQEKLIAIYLDNGYHVIKEKTIFIGTVDTATVHPRDVMRHALRMSAPQVVICHNHPGGSLAFSDNDKKFSLRLEQCCQLMGINLVDHIIVTSKDFLSYRAEELI
ncbi:RadC family protein [Companilactobacillus mishanensis]|uniref:DNA repair protein RadC n=1 Tax=Companilactobacillus mishanensis TaxID=2486008 RepID=A0A5P0ZGR3_9LACO|nr:DNA repair protein RadC [Companilactobacillus mishanensis]MQS44037.1 DNA repair protein RadC [Companilactobacillus mishanensis]MQS52246.1 DNA repair protein RadC [Companilactobacillus mishanensis]